VRLVKQGCAWLLITCAAFPYRFETRTGLFATVSVLDFAFVVCMLVVAVLVCWRGRLAVGNRAVALSLAIPPLLAVCSLLWAVDAQPATKAVVLYVYALGLYVMVVNLLEGAPARFIGALFGWFAVVMLTGALLLYFRVPGFDLFALTDAPIDFERITAAYARFSHPFIGLSNDFAPILTLTLFAIIGLSPASPRRWVKLLAALLAVGLFLTFSRGVLIGLGIVGLAYWTASRFTLRLVGRVLVVGTVIVIAVFAFASRYTVSVGERQLSGKEIVIDRLLNPGTVGLRTVGYRASLAVVWQRPLLGYGTGVFDPGRSGQMSTSHSTYLQQLVFYGVPLGLVSSAAWIALAYLYWNWRARSPEAHRFARAVAAALTIILIAASVETFMEATMPRLLIYLLLGMSTALLNTYDKPSEIPVAA
jgi:O-antigen ligase/polysaccharide polymerase Wzy-like membrane protein